MGQITRKQINDHSLDQTSLTKNPTRYWILNDDDDDGDNEDDDDDDDDDDQDQNTTGRVAIGNGSS